MITAVYFDLGNVILPVDGYRLARKLARFSSLSHDQIFDILIKDLTLNDFEKGAVKPKDWFLTLCSDCRIQGLGFQEFVRLFNDIFKVDIQIAGLLKKLKRRYKLGLISNTNNIHAAYLLKKYKFFRDFDRMWLSHKVGIRKPDPRVYKLALKHFSVKPEQSVFIDDIQANVAGATRVGMKGIHYKGYAPLAQELKKLGVQF